MSGELAVGALLLSLTGVSGGLWALIANKKPWPLAIAVGVSGVMYVSLLQLDKEKTRSGRGKWLLSGVFGSVALVSSVAVGMPWPAAVLAGIEGLGFGFATMMSSWVA